MLGKVILYVFKQLIQMLQIRQNFMLCIQSALLEIGSLSFTLYIRSNEQKQDYFGLYSRKHLLIKNQFYIPIFIISSNSKYFAAFVSISLLRGVVNCTVKYNYVYYTSNTLQQFIKFNTMGCRVCMYVFLFYYFQIYSLSLSRSILDGFIHKKESVKLLQHRCQTKNVVIGQYAGKNNVSVKELNIPARIQKPKESDLEEFLVYSEQFRELKFNLQQQELRKLASSVRDLYTKNKIALFFICAYLLRACQILENEHVSPVQITKIIQKKIKVLMNMTSAQTYRQKYYGKQYNSQLRATYWQIVQKSVVQMTPKKFKLNSFDKDGQIQNIIMQMVEQAIDKYQLFRSIINEIKRLHNAMSCHINLKIKNKDQIPQMKRVKQKLLRDYFKIYGDVCLNTFLNIASKRKIQQIGFQNLLNRVYNEINQVLFVVKDILRAKCMFRSVEHIRSAASTLIGLINQMKSKGLDIKLVQFENRLNKTTCDVMLIIQIDELPTQIQLTLDYDESLFEISHKMYQISRSKVFSPIKLLFDWFQKVAPELLYKLGVFLLQKQQQSLHFASKAINQPDPNIKSILNEKSTHFRHLQKQYELLNEFFHLTSSYQKINGTNQREFQKQIQNQIMLRNYEIISPFISIGTQV